MKKLATLAVMVIVFAIAINLLYSNFLPYKNSMETSSIKVGYKGKMVEQIQTRLKTWGYYNGDINGRYGWSTLRAVKAFQTHNGLQANGIVDFQTLEALDIPTIAGGKKSSKYSNQSDVYLLAKAIHGEGRGEPYVGKVAIGAVVLNRVKNPKFPNSISGVVYQPGAFTAVSDGQINLQAGFEAIKAAREALNGWDPTGGCIYYYNPAKTTNKWIFSRPVVKVIGKHYFAK